MKHLQFAEVLAVVRAVVDNIPPQVQSHAAVCRVDWANLQRPQHSECSRLTPRLPKDSSLSKNAAAVELSGIRDTSGVQLALHTCANAFLSTEVPTNAPLMSIGLDSVAAVEFTNAVSNELATNIPAILLFEHPTLDSVASYLSAGLDLGTKKDPRSMSAIARDANTAVSGSVSANKQA